MTEDVSKDIGLWVLRVKLSRIKANATKAMPVKCLCRMSAGMLLVYMCRVTANPQRWNLSETLHVHLVLLVACFLAVASQGARSASVARGPCCAHLHDLRSSPQHAFEGIHIGRSLSPMVQRHKTEIALDVVGFSGLGHGRF